MATAGDLLHLEALKQIRRGLGCLMWQGARRHAGVHEARKAMRRIRVCLSLAFAAECGDACVLDQSIARLARGLSALRDAQARVDTVKRLLGMSDHPEQRALLRQALAVLTKQRLQAVAQNRLQAVDPEQSQRELRLQVQALDALPWTGADNAQVLSALKTIDRRRVKARRRALNRGGSSAWHRWRRRERQLVLAQKLLADCGIVLSRPPVAHRKLAKRLGLAQDLAILIVHLEHDTVLPAPKRSALVEIVRAARRDLRRRIRRRAEVQAARARAATDSD